MHIRMKLHSKDTTATLTSSPHLYLVSEQDETKGVINESVRGYDLYLMVDVTNYSLTYSVSGHENICPSIDHYR